MFSRGLSSLNTLKNSKRPFYSKCRYSSVAENGVFKLSNGLTVASEHINGETATIGVFVKTGSSYETKENNGISNLFQRLAFKGTKSRNQKQIALDVENIGGSISSYTTREQTVFLANVLKEDVPKAVELLSDVIQNPKFSEESIKNEKSFIISQIEAEKTPEQSAFGFLHSIAFQGSSFGFLVEGTKDSVESITSKDLNEYAANHFVGERISVVGAGAVGDNFSSLVDSNFSSIKSSSSVKQSNPIYVGSAVTLMDDTHHYVEAIVGYKGAPFTSPDYIPLLLLREIVGEYNSLGLEGDRTISKLGEDIGLLKFADNFSTFNISYSSNGLFGVYYKSDSETVADVTNFIISDLVRLSNSASERELDIAKTHLKTKLLAFEGPTQTAERLGNQLQAFGRTIPLAEYFNRIDAIDVCTVRDVAARYFTHVDPVSVASGAIYNYPDYNQLCSWNYWNRT